MFDVIAIYLISTGTLYHLSIHPTTIVSTFIVPSLRPSVQEVLDRALSGTETSNYDLDFETKSKEIRYLLVNATTRRDAENHIIGGMSNYCSLN